MFCLQWFRVFYPTDSISSLPSLCVFLGGCLDLKFLTFPPIFIRFEQMNLLYSYQRFCFLQSCHLTTRRKEKILGSLNANLAAMVFSVYCWIQGCYLRKKRSNYIDYLDLLPLQDRTLFRVLALLTFLSLITWFYGTRLCSQRFLHTRSPCCLS